jgi:hypothetical protein
MVPDRFEELPVFGDSWVEVALLVGRLEGVLPFDVRPAEIKRGAAAMPSGRGGTTRPGGFRASQPVGGPGSLIATAV